MAKSVARWVVVVSVVLAGLVAGCKTSSYNVSFGLAESTGEDFQSAGHMRVDHTRSLRERETDRLAHDLDQDGIPDSRDTDIDGDGIPNDQDPDDDNDGTPDDQDPDSNDDGIIDALDR